MAMSRKRNWGCQPGCWVQRPLEKLTLTAQLSIRPSPRRALSRYSIVSVLHCCLPFLHGCCGLGLGCEFQEGGGPITACSLNSVTELTPEV